MTDSPLKPEKFNITNKENNPSDVAVTVPDQGVKKPIEAPAAEAAKVADGIKSTEAHEPLLQENPHRFVLFPLRYHDVRALDAPRVKWQLG